MDFCQRSLHIIRVLIMESSPAAVAVAINDVRALENIEDSSVVLDDRIERSLEKGTSPLALAPTPAPLAAPVSAKAAPPIVAPAERSLEKLLSTLTYPLLKG